MYAYEIIRLVIMASILVYFIGSFTYFLSETISTDEQIAKGETFQQAFDLHSLELWERLTLSCYFSLTMLSTVGFGDFYPINTREMIYCIFTMLMGVAFFSYIMQSGIDIMTSYKEKKGAINLTDELLHWMLTLQRFNKMPLSFSMQVQIMQNMEYIWYYDRLIYFRNCGSY